MSKGISRSWDRKGIGRFEPSPTPPVTCIQVDGVSYHSDRFYLNRAVDDDPPSCSQQCCCGARSPPPLLDRSQLVASLNLKAAIVATYTLDPEFMVRDMPALFGPNSVVPTLVLHGVKGYSKNNSNKKKSSQEQNASIYSPEQKAKRPRVDLKPAPKNHVFCLDDSSADEEEHDTTMSRVAIKEEEPPEEAWLRKHAAAIEQEDVSFGPSVHLTEVFPTWLPPDARAEIEKQSSKKKQSSVIVLDSDDEDQPDESSYSVDPLVAQRRLRKQGVHHPKFMILLETSGSVVVMVSTSNLTKDRAVDATWVQRFGPASFSKAVNVTDATRCDGSDFGLVLANYLECQSLGAKEGEMIPEAFLRKYLGIISLDDFGKRFRFQDSQVHLIATVPGEHRGRERSTHLGTPKSFLYGAQRVDAILHRLSSSRDVSTRPWLPRSFLSDKDRLIMQPTSLGGFWKPENLTDLIRLYMENGSNVATTSDTEHKERLLEQTDILWPTLDYINEVCRKRNQRRTPSPDSVASDVSSSEIAKIPSTSDEVTSGSFLFLSSITFNTIDLACLSRLSMFEPSYPNQTRSIRSPHFKSYARVFEGNEYQLRKDYGVEKAAECFSWFLLTSACLSRGAQGEAVPLRGFESDDMTYSNFELGVLFVSRLRGDVQSDRVYCWNPNRCHCGNTQRKPGAQMIHLPIPYCIRPHPYHASEDEAEMCATPYFHEIPPGTGFVGQMTLTPLGAKLAAAQL